MTLGEKLSRLRKEHNYTQEQIADILDVSRQAVSKWESDSAYPETENLIKLSKLFDCSLDYLLKDEVEGPKREKAEEASVNALFHYEKKSKKTLFGLPLFHINVGYGKGAKGIIAIGLVSYGFISIGLFSVGILSIGLFAIGLSALGLISLGVFSLGAVATGIFALGAVSIGIFSMGVLPVGVFTLGGSR